MDQQNSEIEKLLAQIDKETEAACRGLYGSAIRAPHHIIEARQAAIAKRHLEKLMSLLRPQDIVSE